MGNAPTKLGLSCSCFSPLHPCNLCNFRLSEGRHLPLKPRLIIMQKKLYIFQHISFLIFDNCGSVACITDIRLFSANKVFVFLIMQEVALKFWWMLYVVFLSLPCSVSRWGDWLKNLREIIRGNKGENEQCTEFSI